MRHPFTDDEYTLLGDDTVEVRTKDGRVGVFDYRARCLSGDRIDVDGHLIQWVHDAPKPAGLQEMSSTAPE